MTGMCRTCVVGPVCKEYTEISHHRAARAATHGKKSTMGDDASSAVVRDTQTTNTKASGAELVNSDEDKLVDTAEKNALKVENGTNNSNETNSN
ncbi:hypothetical protein Syun_014527 [Stephania yunnanensis]|uniref:Uncharacterized protein n=1 Tax=Stephania yunnanensis TaxID=152371 RepID=A0AAP0JLU5_9MAGN